MDNYDLVVIGGGSAGIVAARFGRQLGLAVALVEKSRIGGDCTWTGCIPSKSLLKAANVAHQVRSAGRYGLPEQSPQIDLSQVMGRIRSVIDEIYQAESPEVLQTEGVDVLIGPARFQDRHTLEVNGRELTARRFLICTGAAPFVPPLPGIESIDHFTYENIWDLQAPPRKLTVVGGGPVGCELAQAFNRLGTPVTLLEAADRLLPQDEPEAAELLKDLLAAEGIDVRLGSAVSSVSPSASSPGNIRLSLSNGGPVDTEALLLALGRRPNVGGLGLEAASVAHDRGGIKVDRYLRTSQPHIYAAGDCIGGYQFTHYAAHQGFTAVRNAFLPLNDPGVLSHVPWATFTDPEVAHVGLTEAAALERYPGKTAVSRFPMKQVDRAVTDGEPEGFIKVVYRPDGRLLGATILGPRAGEMVHEYALALDRRLKLSHLAKLVHVYPTYSMGTQQLAAGVSVERLLSGRLGGLVRRLARRR